MTGPITVRLSRQFNASPERVFDAWFQPACFANFLLGDAQAGKVLQSQFEPRIGGRFMVAASRNRATVELRGAYLEINRPERLVFSLTALDSGCVQECVTLELAALGRGCLLVLHHEMNLERAPNRPQVQLAWSAALRGLPDTGPRQLSEDLARVSLTAQS